MALIVNGERIDDSIIQQEEQSLRSQMQRMSAENGAREGVDLAELERNVPDWSKQNVIERILLRQEALKDTAPIPTEEVDQAVEEVKKRYGGDDKQEASAVSDEDIRREVETRIRLDRLIGKITAKVSSPKNKAVAESYRMNREQFKLPERIHAGHIVKHVGDGVGEETARAAVEEARQALEAGGVFEELADKFSDCPGSGGDLGYFPRGEMVEEFDQVVFGMEPGEVSPIFQTVFGFHIAKLYERFPETIRPLGEVRKEIEKQLHSQKQNHAIENFVDALRAKAEVREVVSSADENVAVATASTAGQSRELGRSINE